jgi:hypothetical protein
MSYYLWKVDRMTRNDSKKKPDNRQNPPFHTDMQERIESPDTRVRKSRSRSAKRARQVLLPSAAMLSASP